MYVLTVVIIFPLAVGIMDVLIVLQQIPSLLVKGLVYSLLETVVLVPEIMYFQLGKFYCIKRGEERERELNSQSLCMGRVILSNQHEIDTW